MSEPRCKHNWVMPPECPQCVSDERDSLEEQLAVAKAERDEAFNQYAGAVVQRDTFRADVARLREALVDLMPLVHVKGNSHENEILDKALSASRTPAAPVVPSEPLMGLDFVRWVPLADAEALAKALEHALPFIRSTIGLGAYGSLVEANEVHSALAAFRAKHPAPGTEVKP